MWPLTTAFFSKNRWIWYWIAFLFIRCCTSCLFGNFFVQASQVTKLVIKTTKSFSPKLGVLQASNLNFIDSLFSCRDNGGFLAELNSDLRIEAFTSLIMVSMIHICLCLVINDGFVTNIPGWKLVKWHQPLVVGTLRLSRGGAVLHETIVQVQEWSSARTTNKIILVITWCLSTREHGAGCTLARTQQLWSTALGLLEGERYCKKKYDQIGSRKVSKIASDGSADAQCACYEIHRKYIK